MMWHDVEQNTPEWDVLKLGKASSSGYGKFMANFGKAFGEPAHRYALQIALEQLTGRKAERSFKNDDMDRGHEEEPLARMKYQEQHFVEVTNGGFFDCGQWGDSPDGLVDHDGVIEIKSVIAPTHEATIKRGRFDPAYKWQMAGHLDATGRDWVDFVSFCPDYPEHSELIVLRTYRADMAEELAQLAERRAEFLALVSEKYSELQQKAA